MNPSTLPPPTRASADALDARALLSQTIQRTYKIAIAQSIALAFVGFALWQLLPLKQTVPYVIEVNKTTGEVSVPPQQQASKFTPAEDSILFFARRWIRSEFTIHPQMNQQNEALALSTLRGEAAIQKHNVFRKETDKTFERIAREPNLVRDVKIDSIQSVSGAVRSVVANVTLTTSGRAGVSTERKLITLSYELLPPSTERDREIHPIGFFVVDFNIDSLK